MFGGESDSVELRQLLEPTRTLLLTFMLVFLLEALVKRRVLGPLDRTEVWMIAFFISLLMSIFLQSARFNFSMRIALNAFMVPFLAYFVMRRLVRHEMHFRRLIQAIGYLVAYLIVIGLAERLSHPALLYRLGGPFRDEGVYYMVLIVGFLLTLTEALSHDASRRVQPILPSWLKWCLVCCTPIVILLTMERGNWVGFLSGTWLLGILGHRLVGESRRIVTIGLICTLIPIAIISTQMLTPEEIVEGRVGYSKSIQGRLLTWQVAIQDGLKQPLLGIGFNNLRDVLAQNIIESDDGVRSYLSTHNSYIAFLVEQGIVGLFLFLAILFSILQMGIKLYRKGRQPQDRWRGVVTIAILAAYMVPSLFASKLHTPNPWNTILIFSFFGGVSGLYSRSRGYYVRRYAVPVSSTSA
ncbi:MAG: hypothetical protein ETSY2_16405 [Candidatus Entotheonella gemina]|uniref:O-antigen ligase-related domain-containing protein n=1 Tax=Candidatus Entotheonella gemina TaxID=1429439 RepID=W4M862_9BACT|nr:MAG: hypothetical protein ETSY2_16405 [Candidatus Entotheonella gemina]